jgi:DNA-directed RNA polymerase specialized sigma54-like protein
MAEQFLSQTQSQRLSMVLAPQLRQSLELLQVPMLELRSLVQQEMEQNPTLEDQPMETEQIEIEPAAEKKEEDATLKDEFEKLARLDDEWRDYFNQNQGSQRYSSEEAAKRQFFLDSLSQPESLQQHLMDQLALADLPEHDRQIGELLIGSTNEDGFLTSPWRSWPAAPASRAAAGERAAPGAGVRSHRGGRARPARVPAHPVAPARQGRLAGRHRSCATTWTRWARAASRTSRAP